ncbi:MAG: YbaN family protein [Microthrixaceae bacterium]
MVRSGPTRWLWAAAGLVLVGVGGLGAVVPGLPSTVFLLGAAACFSRSSPRLERWLLGLPVLGRVVTDWRAGLGMARSAKVTTVSMIAGFSGLGAVLAGGRLGLAIGLLGVIGVVTVLWRVPTTERVLAARKPGADPHTPIDE